MSPHPQAKKSQGSPPSAVPRPGGGKARAKSAARLWPLLAAAVLAAAVLPFAGSAKYGFVWDDKVVVGPALDVRGAGDIVRLWNTPFDSLLRDPVLYRNYFRPVVLLSLAWDRAWSGDRPAGYHRTNLFWYALACLFLWLFAWEISGRPVAAAAGAALFALHPTHPESVCFVLGRTDVICGAFLFASLWAAARWGPRIRRAWLKLAPAAGLLLLALWSKEVALFASPLLVLVLWLRERPLRSSAVALAALPVLAAGAVYLASRLAVLGPHTLPAVSPVEGMTPQLFTSVAVVARYLPLLFFPVSLSARHEIAPLQGPDPMFFAGLLTLGATLAGLFVLIRRRSMWAIPLFLFASALLPLCYVRMIAGALVAERFLFIPSGALALAVALVPGTVALIAGSAAAAACLWLLPPRVAIWKDDAALFTSMLRDSPNSAYVHAVLGGHYYQARDLGRAIQHHKRAFQLSPEFNESLLNLGAAEEEAGLADSAFAHVQLLLRLRPRYAAAWYALGNLHVRADRPDSAVTAYETAIRLEPGFAQAENNLGVVLERMGRVEEAVAHYRRAGEAMPGYPDAANNLARLEAARAGK